MSEMLTGPKKIVDGLTEVFRGLTRMCEGMAEQIELLEFTSEDAEDEDKLLPPAKLPPVDTAPKVPNRTLRKPRRPLPPTQRARPKPPKRRLLPQRRPHLPKKLLQRKTLPQMRQRRSWPTFRLIRRMTCPLMWIPAKKLNPNSLP